MKNTNWKHLLIVLFLSSIAFSCKNSKDTAHNKQAITSEVKVDETKEQPSDSVQYSQESLEHRNRTVKGMEDSLFFRIERTSCFGRCPTYSTTVYQSGYVEYHGKRNVEKIGFFSAWLTDEQKNVIIQKCEEINFFKLNDRYDANMTDVPSTILSFQYEDNRKVVVDRANAPSELHVFEKEIEMILDGLDYTAVKKY